MIQRGSSLSRALCSFATVVCFTPALAPAMPMVFETEILALDLRGVGQLPIPTGGEFVPLPVELRISPTAGARHLGRLLAVDQRGGGFAVDSFFDVFFDVTFLDLNGNPLLHVPGIQDRLSARWMTPSLHGLSPLDGLYHARQMLNDVPIGDSFFDVFYELDLSLRPRSGADDGDPKTFFADGFANFSGEINPPFGPFELLGPLDLTLTPLQVPEPGPLSLLLLGILGAVAPRRAASAPR